MTLNVKDEYEKLMSYSTSLYSLYKRLAQLEFNGNYNLFPGVIEEIRILKKCEMDLCNLISENNDNLMSLLLYISNNVKIHFTTFNVDDIINFSENDIIKRILYNIQSLLVLKNSIRFDIKNFASAKKNMILFNYKILKILEDDWFFAYLNINQSKILGESNAVIRNNLIMSKYNTIFLNSTFDQYMLDNNYSIDMDNIFFTNDFLFSLMNIDRDDILKFRFDYFIKTCKNQVDCILKYNLNNIDNDLDVNSKMEIRNSILISALLFLNKDVNDDFLSKWLEKKLNFIGEKDLTSVFDKYVMSSFLKSYEFSKRVKVISLNGGSKIL